MIISAFCKICQKETECTVLNEWEMQPRIPTSPRLHIKAVRCTVCGKSFRVTEKIPRVREDE